MSILRLVRENIRMLKPYASARTEYDGKAAIFLDANENPFDTGLNRYPDPLQRKLKERIAGIKGLEPNRIFLGNGSDEVIDLLIRIFCEPGTDQIIILPPTYGMYKVSAAIAGVEVIEVPLDDALQPDAAAVTATFSNTTKLLFICHPNNPTGNSMELSRIEVLTSSFDGIVVVDEAYIDFSKHQSCLSLLDRYENLVVMQTFSKAWGLAGIRLGIGMTSIEIVDLLNKVKPPYNINSLTQRAALKALNEREDKEERVGILLQQREELRRKLSEFSFVRQVFPSDTNFLLVKVDQPNVLYRYLIDKKIVVRNRSTVLKCEGCLRFTVGTPQENLRLIDALTRFQAL